MKCPKCLYIGFETGDRCKNCGYDFSLLALADDAVEAVKPAPPELAIRQAEPAFSGVALDLAPALGDTWSGPVIDRFRDLPEGDGPAMTLAGPASPPAGWTSRCARSTPPGRGWRSNGGADRPRPARPQRCRMKVPSRISLNA